ncbi:uncharacterized protein LOC110035804 [Phalaenopsis equestris]|uniref:uncharacterized protein LOC110035804 n=1 Tax=Phalaenopsis equestris TaxID=78828 RepID=UPI0009E4FD10|nr:uncharacterized protein LOC110035804 [Phalaenopsis equestris]
MAWFVWMARNKLKFDEVHWDANAIATHCYNYLQKLHCHRKLPEILCTSSLIGSMKFQAILVHWNCPPMGWLKVNTDGSLISPNAGFGGDFRNTRGECLLYFQSLAKAEDPLEAEAQAIYWAVFLAIKCSSNLLMVETYSMILLNILEGRISASWYLIQWITSIQTLSLKIKLSLSHTFREGNSPANWLAKASLHTQNTIIDTCTTPHLELLLNEDLVDLYFLRVLPV